MCVWRGGCISKQNSAKPTLGVALERNTVSHSVTMVFKNINFKEDQFILYYIILDGDQTLPETNIVLKYCQFSCALCFNNSSR